MRILHVVPTLGYGGVSKVVLNYYEKVNKKEYLFDFITHGKVEDFHAEIITTGSKIYYLKTIRQIGIIKYFYQLKRVIESNNYDIVHIHIGHLTGVYAMMFRIIGHRHIICHAHTTKCVNNKHSMFMPIFRKLSVLFSDNCIACGKKAGDFCFGNNKYVIMNNALDFKKFKDITDKQVHIKKQELGLENCDKIIGHVGLFSSIKNHEFIINILEELVKKEDDIKLVLVGEGKLKKQIESLVYRKRLTDKVLFLGNRQDVYILMKMFDVFILPSIHEGLPVVGIEAQAAGTYCIFSQGIDSSVDLGIGIVTFLPIDQGINCWVDKISCILNNNNISTDMIYEKLIEKGYEITATAVELQHIYRSICISK